MKKSGFVPYDSCQPYIACSSDSSIGFCGSVDTTPSDINTCRTCSTFGVDCAAIDQVSFGKKILERDGRSEAFVTRFSSRFNWRPSFAPPPHTHSQFPNATIAEYGTVTGADNMKSEIFARGPIACGVNAEPLLDYAGGVFSDDAIRDKLVNHIISIVGWGTDSDSGEQYWIVRNSWGEYWGEMGYFRLAMGSNQLGIESECSWAVPGTFTEQNFPCFEDGSNCGDSAQGRFIDPSDDLSIIDERLRKF